MEFLHKYSTANNSLLRIIAAFLFVSLPAIAFVLGVQYQMLLDSSNQNSILKLTPDTRRVVQKTSDWKTYVNTKYHYEIDYPGNWIVRESPDTKTGAAFQPADKPKDYSNETITINVSRKVMSDKPITSFEEYAKVAATLEIQSYKKLASIKKITTKSGITGYQTTWIVGPPPMINAPKSQVSTPEESSPFVYFEIPNNTTSLLQVKLDNKQDMEIYEKMVSTVRFSD